MSHWIGDPLPASPCRRAHGLAGSLLAILAAMFCAPAMATPRIPASDDTVLQHVPAASETRRLEPLRARLATHPQDLQTVLALAQGYLEIGRENADPRFVSYAQATLAPWLSHPNPSPAVLTVAASTLQYLHRFDEALALLGRALAAQPLDGQAWLTKATILQVQGRFDEARKACRPLTQTSGQLIALSCLTSVNSLTGRLQASYDALQAVFTDDPRLSPGLRIWILEQLADMAQRSGDDRAAEAHLLAALRVSSKDAYVKAQYADLLLGQNRNTEVVQLLSTDEQQDNLLLRLAIAGSRLQSAAGRHWGDVYRARYEAARRDGDYTHLREQARFVLQVRCAAAAALKLAESNWQVQREPADVRVYVQAAAAAGDRQAARRILEWIEQTHYEDRTIDAEGNLARRIAR
jgi:tetratricopeptide (TPR) repeat protein